MEVETQLRSEDEEQGEVRESEEGHEIRQQPDASLHSLREADRSVDGRRAELR